MTEEPTYSVTVEESARAKIDVNKDCKHWWSQDG